MLFNFFLSTILFKNGTTVLLVAAADVCVYHLVAQLVPVVDAANIVSGLPLRRTDEKAELMAMSFAACPTCNVLAHS